MRAAWLVVIAGCGFAPAGITGSNVTIDAPLPSDATDASGPMDAPDAAVAIVGWVQGTSATGNDGDVYALDYTQAQRAGDLDVVVVSWGTTSTHINSIGDTLNNTFTRVGAPFTGGNLTQAIYYAPNIAAGTNRITVQFDATANAPQLRIAEYAGVVTSSPLEHMTEVSNNSGQSLSATLLATANPHDLLVAADTVESSTDQTDASYTVRLTELGNVLMDRIVMATGTYNVTAHQTASSGWIIQIAAFKMN